MRCISICHCLGAAVGSLERCTHVIPIPESHNLALVFLGICVYLSFILACTTFNLVLVFSTHHMFIHDDENV